MNDNKIEELETKVNQLSDKIHEYELKEVKHQVLLIRLKELVSIFDSDNKSETD